LYFLLPLMLMFATTPQYPSYDDIMHKAIYDCDYAIPEDIDLDLLELLVEVEKRHNVPPSLRGMLLAAACHESGYDPLARGDHSFHPQGKAKAIGLFQMWPWWERNKPWGYEIDRTKPAEAAEAYMRHVTKRFLKIRSDCKINKSNRKAIWLASWATAIRAPKKTGRCNEKPRFYRIMKRWHKDSLKERREYMEECAKDGGCGC